MPKDSGSSRAKGPRVVSVENCGLPFTDNNVGVSGLDCGYSIPIGKKTLWLFGDVFLANPKTLAYSGEIVSNCAALVNAGTGPDVLRDYKYFTNPKTGMARMVIPLDKNDGPEIRLWPLGSLFDSANKRLYTYYYIISIVAEGPMGFRTDGIGLAVADVSDLSSITYERLRAPNGSWFWWKQGEAPQMGLAVVDGNKDKYCYTVGNSKPTTKMSRVLKSRIADLSAYEYFAGYGDSPKWSKDVSKAADVEGLIDFPTELSVAYNAYLGGYLAVHSIHTQAHARLSLAENPWGPYKQIAEIQTPKQEWVKECMCYAGKEHTELSEDNGRVVYMTYVDGRRYWLNVLRITFDK